MDSLGWAKTKIRYQFNTTESVTWTCKLLCNIIIPEKSSYVGSSWIQKKCRGIWSNFDGGLKMPKFGKKFSIMQYSGANKSQIRDPRK